MNASHHSLVLALYATTRGFAFVLLEGPLSPFDWGTREFRGQGKNEACLRAMCKLVTSYEPASVVIEDASARESRRARRIRNLHESFTSWAEAQGVVVYQYTRRHIRKTFAGLGAATKDEIAAAIARHVPALDRWQPPPRRPWMTVHPRMGVFDATALAFTHFHLDAGLAPPR